MTVKLSISISSELATILEDLAQQRDQDRSPLIETLLREHDLVRDGLQRYRSSTKQAASERTGDEARRKLMETIRNHPGITAADLSRRVNLAWSTVDYHLRILQQTRAIDVNRIQREKRVFAAETPDHQKPLLATLSDPTTNRVLEEIQRNPPRRLADLSSALGLSPKVIRRHLTNLMEAGVVQRHGGVHPAFTIHQPRAGGQRR